MLGIVNWGSKVVMAVMVVVLVGSMVVYAQGESIITVYRYFQQDTGDLWIQPDHELEDYVIVRLEFATNECGSGWYWKVTQYTGNKGDWVELETAVDDVMATGEASPMLESDLNDWLIGWYNVVQNDHPYPAGCMQVYLPMVVTQ